MRSFVGSRLPRFTKEEAHLVKGSFDFLGLNYYTTYYASNYPAGYKAIAPSYATDSRTKTSEITVTNNRGAKAIVIDKIKGGANGDVAVDQYHRYKEDVRLMKDLGLDAYRFSISWSRILPSTYSNNYFFVMIFRSFLASLEDFTNFVDLCFNEFGDRVKHWITLNEPHTYTNGGYVIGTFAPGRCTKVLGNCTAGNSATEPYVVAHNLLLSHASAVKLFMDPLTKGDYPPSMRSLVGSRLPRFTKEETQLVKGSLDFLGLNYYTTYYASNYPAGYKVIAPSYASDSRANTSGYSEFDNSTFPLMEALKDPWRMEYYSGHLYYLHEAIRQGVDVRGYFAWSLLDNFEWADGYSIRFGLVFIDYNNGLQRHPKHSAYWLQKFLHA
ncbi:Beta-glucosidase 12 [Nymphaea thermarum]|nr:Beta-glucosidase 12 [Nymphaea thermarum]